MPRTKEEAAKALRNALRFGNLSSSEVSDMSKEDVALFTKELSTYMSGGVDDFSRDEVQRERLQKLAEEAAGA